MRITLFVVESQLNPTNLVIGSRVTQVPQSLMLESHIRVPSVPWGTQVSPCWVPSITWGKQVSPQRVPSVPQGTHMSIARSPMCPQSPWKAIPCAPGAPEGDPSSPSVLPNTRIEESHMSRRCPTLLVKSHIFIGGFTTKSGLTPRSFE